MVVGFFGKANFPHSCGNEGFRVRKIVFLFFPATNDVDDERVFAEISISCAISQSTGDDMPISSLDASKNLPLKSLTKANENRLKEQQQTDNSLYAKMMLQCCKMTMIDVNHSSFLLPQHFYDTENYKPRIMINLCFCLKLASEREVHSTASLFFCV
jgi:hypothetical protein